MKQLNNRYFRHYCLATPHARGRQVLKSGFFKWQFCTFLQIMDFKRWWHILSPIGMGFAVVFVFAWGLLFL
jgi:hypothetical protein